MPRTGKVGETLNKQKERDKYICKAGIRAMTKTFIFLKCICRGWSNNNTASRVFTLHMADLDSIVMNILGYGPKIKN